ncbi:family 20 glycosylhydrolase [Prevotella sp.]|uniref:family 20 glycosylhydrolase n=1 Tax=Prevotella sp. TaxID=59823 RepID=UPI0025D54039|nr:family 20 glycosylhydrolase [Prevotella sp.]
MKRIFLLSAAAIVSAALSAQTVAKMSDMKPETKAMAVSLKLTGELTTEGNSDYRQLRDLCFQLRDLDLSDANSTVLPKNAFHSRHQLERIKLPKILKTIESQAFFACDKLQEITIPASVTSVGKAAFSSCKGMESVVIEGTPVLGEYAFARLEGLKTVKVNSKVPPRADVSTFYGINRSQVKLIVPKGAEAAYKKAPGWSRFFAEPKIAKEVSDPSTCLAPYPTELNVLKGAKGVDVQTAWNIVAAEGLQNEQDQARRMLTERIGNIVNNRQRGIVLNLSLDQSLTDNEAYTLAVDAKGVTIKGKTAQGVFWGLMTLDQILRGSGNKECVDIIPQLTIKDAPRTHVRELMVDPARTFIPFDDLKAFIPEMARYKLNALHLHLVDDQAWRIEIKKYPQLTEQASSRWGQDDMLAPYKGFYTQEQMRELVKYAATYHVEIVPEIEMPGHEVAAISVFPELTCHQRQVPVRTTCGVSNELLCPGNDFTYEFLGNVFKEITDIFPSKYIHLGGDEAGNPALDCWTDCPKCKALKRKLGIPSTDRSENWKLQGYLFDRIIELLRDTYHKTPMFWYESDFKEIQPGCVTFAWRSGQTKEALDAAVRNNARIMLCPGEHCYFDYPMAKGDMPEVNWGMPVTSLKDAYALDPAWGMGAEFEKNNLFGVAGTLWSECINTPERISYQAYPRAIALAEVGWSTANVRSWEGFVKRLKPTMKDMMRRGVTASLEF